MLLHGQAIEQAGDLIDGERFGMRVVAGRPFGQHGIVLFQSHVVDGVFVDQTVWDLRNRTSGYQNEEKK
jgi:hypothetical protein